MNEKPQREFEQQILNDSLLFFGKITASVSHELNNVLSIIDQTGGLLDDLLYNAQQGGEIPHERLRTISDKLSAQIERGVRIIKRMNTFAHTVDDPIKKVDIPNLVDTFCKLMQRLTGLKKVDLQVEHQTSMLQVDTSPFFLQMLIFNIIQVSLQNTETGGTLCISTSGTEEKALIEIDRIAGKYDLDPDFVIKLSDKIGGKLELIKKGEKELFIIELSGFN